MTNRSRLETLDVLRGFAALAVAWFHFRVGNESFRLPESWDATGSLGWLGVQVFFVISGFVIPFSMWRGGYHVSQDVFRFLWKRTLRLYPPFLVSLTIVVVLPYLAAMTPWFRGRPPSFTLLDLLLNGFLLCDLCGGEWLNPVYWTLAIEVQFYLVAALFTPALLHSRSMVRVWTAPALAMTAWIPSDGLVFEWMPVFALGMLGFQWMSRRIGNIAAVCSAVVILGVCINAQGVLIAAVSGVTALVICVVPVPSGRILGWLGAISYSFYLLHAPVGNRVFNLGARLPAGAVTESLVAGAVILVSLCAAALFYYLVERPSMKSSARIRYSGLREDRQREAVPESEPAATSVLGPPQSASP